MTLFLFLRARYRKSVTRVTIEDNMYYVNELISVQTIAAIALPEGNRSHYITIGPIAISHLQLECCVEGSVGEIATVRPVGPVESEPRSILKGILRILTHDVPVAIFIHESIIGRVGCSIDM